MTEYMSARMWVIVCKILKNLKPSSLLMKFLPGDIYMYIYVCVCVHMNIVVEYDLNEARENYFFHATEHIVIHYFLLMISHHKLHTDTKMTLSRRGLQYADCISNKACKTVSQMAWSA